MAPAALVVKGVQQPGRGWETAVPLCSFAPTGSAWRHGPMATAAAPLAHAWGALAELADAVGASLPPAAALLQVAPAGVTAVNYGLALLLALLLALNIVAWRVYGATFALWHKLKLE